MSVDTGRKGYKKLLLMKWAEFEFDSLKDLVALINCSWQGFLGVLYKSWAMNTSGSETINHAGCFSNFINVSLFCITRCHVNKMQKNNVSFFKFQSELKSFGTNRNIFKHPCGTFHATLTQKRLQTKLQKTVSKRRPWWQSLDCGSFWVCIRRLSSWEKLTYINCTRKCFGELCQY